MINMNIVQYKLQKGLIQIYTWCVRRFITPCCNSQNFPTQEGFSSHLFAQLLDKTSKKTAFLCIRFH